MTALAPYEVPCVGLRRAGAEAAGSLLVTYRVSRDGERLAVELPTGDLLAWGESYLAGEWDRDDWGRLAYLPDAPIPGVWRLDLHWQGQYLRRRVAMWRDRCSTDPFPACSRAETVRTVYQGGTCYSLCVRCWHRVSG